MERAGSTNAVIEGLKDKNKGGTAWLLKALFIIENKDRYFQLKILVLAFYCDVLLTKGFVCAVIIENFYFDDFSLQKFSSIIGL